MNPDIFLAISTEALRNFGCDCVVVSQAILVRDSRRLYLSFLLIEADSCDFQVFPTMIFSFFCSRFRMSKRVFLKCRPLFLFETATL